MNFYTMKINIGIFRSILQLQTIFAFHFILFKSTYFFRKRQKCQVFTHFPSKSNKMNLYVFKEIYSICRSRHWQFRVSKKCKMKGPKTVQLQDNFYCYYEIAIFLLFKLNRAANRARSNFYKKNLALKLDWKPLEQLSKFNNFSLIVPNWGKLKSKIEWSGKMERALIFFHMNKNSSK